MPTIFDVLRKINKLVPRSGSDQDGEIVASPAAIRRTLKAADLDLHDLVAELNAPSGRRCDADRCGRAGWVEPVTLDDVVEVAMRFRGFFSDWEVRFLADIQGRDKLSVEQLSIVECLLDRARGIALRPTGGQACADGQGQLDGPEP